MSSAPPTPSIESASAGLRSVIATASRGLVEREYLVELTVLAAVAREHLLVIGPPGTAKSEAVRRIARLLGGQYFEYLLGRFTEPNEIFGPVDLRRLKEGKVEIDTHGMLPEAELAFLDEIFLGSTAILNTLLSLLNERTFRRGHTVVQAPLRICVGASNALPEDERLAAFADRFLVRAFVDPVGDPMLEDLLHAGWALGRAETETEPAALGWVDALAAAARAMDLTAVTADLAHAIRVLRAAGIELSDRRVVRVQRLVAAAAALAGRSRATEADLWPLVFALPTRDAQTVGRDALRALLAASENPAVQHAAADGSLGPRARAALLLREGEAAFAAAGDAPLDEASRLRLEGVAREIDATFMQDALPAELAALRARLVETLGGGTHAIEPDDVHA